VASHGTDAGWNNAYGDGQATFGSILVDSDNWIIDGTTRNESNWKDGSAYGFRFTGGIISSTAQGAAGICAANVTIKYGNFGAADNGNILTGNEPDYAVKVAGFSELCQNWTISRNYMHNTLTTFHINGANGGVIEYNYLKHGFSKEAIRGQVQMSNFTIRHNIFEDSCQGNNTWDGGACTAVIALFDGSSWNNTKIYGNVMYNTTNESVQDAIVVVGGLEDPRATGVEIYNNTFVGFKAGNRSILVRGTASVCRNNLAYNTGTTVSYSCSTTSHNTQAAADPFISASAGNFRLRISPGTGTLLSSPYDLDMDGAARGRDGVWDVGAFEGGSVTTLPAPAPPMNVRVIR
jgi:hypothetical protein